MNRLYQMDRAQFRGLLAVAGERVPFGVYAVEKDGYAELLCQSCASKSQLKQARRDWSAQGYRVYANGL